MSVYCKGLMMHDYRQLLGDGQMQPCLQDWHSIVDSNFAVQNATRMLLPPPSPPLFFFPFFLSAPSHTLTRASYIAGHHPQQSGSVESIDVYEIARCSTKLSWQRLLCLRDYCANFESIGCEWQKHILQLWSTYVSDMESPARVVMAIDQREANERKAP